MMEKNIPLVIVILAAGNSKRMNSSLPKVCHFLGGKPLLKHVLDTAKHLSPTQCFVVYGNYKEEITNISSDPWVTHVHQPEQLGTAHAVAQVLPQIKTESRILVLYGDVPLVEEDTLVSLLRKVSENELGLITGNVNDPKGFGRILRNQQGEIIGVVEEKDATDEQKKIKEIFSGIMLISSNYFSKWWPSLDNHNVQNEYYLPSVLPFAIKESITIQSVSVGSYEELLGVNTRNQLSELERFYQRKQANRLMEKGVTLLDPSRIDIRGEIEIEKDVILDIDVIIEGSVSIGKNTYIGPFTIIKDSQIGKDVKIMANTIIEGSIIADGCTIGPFARLRPGTTLNNEVRIGNFVEIKKSKIDEKTKINHLSYIGDAELGKSVNIGAGTITCNYDGVNKFQTIIEDRAFIGSDTQLVAPVRIGKDTTIGAGSTITKDAPPDSLVLSRAEQKIIPQWKRPNKVKS